MFLTQSRLTVSYFRLQENHKYHIRIFAKNEVGISEPLETEEPYTVQKPMGKPRMFIIILYFVPFYGLTHSMSEKGDKIISKCTFYCQRRILFVSLFEISIRLFRKTK